MMDITDFPLYKDIQGMVEIAVDNLGPWISFADRRIQNGWCPVVLRESILSGFPNLVMPKGF